MQDQHLLQMLWISQRYSEIRTTRLVRRIRRSKASVNRNRGAPVAVNDSYQVAANKSLAVNSTTGVLSNDSDPDGDPLNANLSTGSSNGTVSLSANGGFTYTPNANFVGDDFFTYRASDGLANSNLATVTITVEAIKAMPWLMLLLDD